MVLVCQVHRMVGLSMTTNELKKSDNFEAAILDVISTHILSYSAAHT